MRQSVACRFLPGWACDTIANATSTKDNSADRAPSGDNWGQVGMVRFVSWPAPDVFTRLQESDVNKDR